MWNEPLWCRVGKHITSPEVNLVVDRTNPELSIVVPFFNEETNLRLLVEEIEEALGGLAQTYEVLLVDDGSTDRSLEVARELCADRPRLRVLRLRRNSGQSAALAVGFRAARGSVVVTLDADLQNDPRDIPMMVAQLGDCDLVSGVRTERHDDWVRRMSSRIANRVRNLVVHDQITDVGCSLKAYRREFLEGLPTFDGMHRFLPALVQMFDARVKEVPVNHRPRIHGESKYGIGNRLWRGLLDLAAVRWMQARWVDPTRLVIVELDEPAEATPGSTFSEPVAKVEP